MTAAPSFKTIPEQDELAEVQRDLRFHPSTVTDPKILSREQLEQFNREGYIKGVRIFSDEEIQEVRTYFDALLEQVIAAGGNSYSISTAHLKYGKVYDLLTNPRIVRCVKDVLGESAVAWGSHFFCKMPGDGKVVNWHQDSSYWPLTPSKAVTVWLAIDDADVENACMRFIPGSHHYGHLTYKLTEESADAVLNQEVENAEEFGQPVDDELKAGEISIHSDLLLHGSRANDSSRRRCGLTLRYTTTDVHAGLDWNQKGVLLGCEDPSGHWANNLRPTTD